MKQQRLLIYVFIFSSAFICIQCSETNNGNFSSSDIFSLLHFYIGEKSNQIFNLSNPLINVTDYYSQYSDHYHPDPSLRFSFNKNVFLNLNQSTEDHVLYRSKDGLATLKLIRPRQSPFLEFIFVYRQRNGQRPELCFYVDPHDWPMPFIDRTISDILDFQELTLATNMELYKLRLDSTRRHLLENLFVNKAAAAAIMLDDPHPWAVFSNIHTPEKKFCFTTTATSNIAPLSNHSEYGQLKLRILLAANISEAHRQAVLAGWVSRNLRAQLPMTIVERPFMSLDSFGYDSREQRQKLEAALFDVNFTRFHLIYDRQMLDAIEETDEALGIGKLSSSVKKNCSDCLVLLKLNPDEYNETLVSQHFANNDIHGFVWNTLGADLLNCENDTTLDNCSLITRDDILRQHPNFVATAWANQWLNWMSNYPNGSSKLLATDTAYKLQEQAVLLQLTMTLPDVAVTITNNEDLQRQLNIPKDDEFKREFTNVLFEAQVASLAGYQYMQPRLLKARLYPKELPTFASFKRWIRATAFLPSMTIPLPPSVYSVNYGPEFVKRLIKLREEVALPAIRQHLPAWWERGIPLVRPLWYEFFDDPSSFEHPEEFMLGPDLLIVPLTETIGSGADNIYLPPSCWICGWNNEPANLIRNFGASSLKKAWIPNRPDIYFFRRRHRCHCREYRLPQDSDNHCDHVLED